MTSFDVLHEHYGGSLVANVTADNYRLRPAGRTPGSVRLYKLTPDANRSVVLPKCTKARPGESCTVWNASGAFSIVAKGFNGTTIATIPPGHVAEFFLITAGDEGTWHVALTDSGVGESPSLLLERVPLDMTVTSDTLDFNLRDYWRTHGYDGITPAALRVFVGSPDRLYLMGSTNDGAARDCGFNTGDDWPSGTTLLLFNYGRIIGRGGNGGRGGDVPPGLLSQAGGNGNHGMRVRIPTVLVNYGTVAGGGGGGGGGIAATPGSGGPTLSGSGGGGGAGHAYSDGGQPGTGSGGREGIGGSAFTAGGGGSIGAPNGTGAVGPTDGGSGGGPGQAGFTSTGGTPGGAAGSAILVETSGAGSLTKAPAGTILGAEGTY